MARIKGKNTKPEMALRRALHALGFRYRLHVRGLPGKPDLVLPRYRATVFIHGCFWHGHDCELFRIPATRSDFWREKIAGNRGRGDAALDSLAAMGWRTLVVWECAMRGKSRRSVSHIADAAADWLRSDATQGEITGVASCQL